VGLVHRALGRGNRTLRFGLRTNRLPHRALGRKIPARVRAKSGNPGAGGCIAPPGGTLRGFRDTLGVELGATTGRQLPRAIRHLHGTLGGYFRAMGGDVRAKSTLLGALCRELGAESRLVGRTGGGQDRTTRLLLGTLRRVVRAPGPLTGTDGVDLGAHRVHYGTLRWLIRADRLLHARIRAALSRHRRTQGFSLRALGCQGRANGSPPRAFRGHNRTTGRRLASSSEAVSQIIWTSCDIIAPGAFSGHWVVGTDRHLSWTNRLLVLGTMRCELRTFCRLPRTVRRDRRTFRIGFRARRDLPRAKRGTPGTPGLEFRALGGSAKHTRAFGGHNNTPCGMRRAYRPLNRALRQGLVRQRTEGRAAGAERTESRAFRSLLGAHCLDLRTEGRVSAPTGGDALCQQPRTHRRLSRADRDFRRTHGGASSAQTRCWLHRTTLGRGIRALREIGRTLRGGSSTGRLLKGTNRPVIGAGGDRVCRDEYAYRRAFRENRWPRTGHGS